LVDVEGRLPHAEEGPPTPLEVALTSEVRLVGVRPVPPVAVALDGKATAGADDDEVDAVPLRLVLRQDGEATVDDAVVDTLLEERVEAFDPFVVWDGRRLTDVQVTTSTSHPVGVVEQL